MRRLLAGHELVFVKNAQASMRETKANTQVSILSQTSFIPAAQLLHQLAAHKDGVAAEWCHADARVEVQGRLEPEEVLQHVEEAEPAGSMVHQLHAALHGIHIFIKHGGIDDVKNIGM